MMVLKGVTLDKKNNKFVASISLYGYKLVLGVYDDAKDASDAYAAAVEKRKNGGYKGYKDAYDEYLRKAESMDADGGCDEKVGSVYGKFYDWCDASINLEDRLYKSELYEKYIQENGDMSLLVSQRRFSFWIDRYVSYKGYHSYKGKSSAGRWIYIRG